MTKHISILLFLICGSIHAQRADFDPVDFTKADSIADSHKGNKLYNLPLLAYNLTNSLETKVEQFRALYTWVSKNIESDYGYMEKILRKRKKLQQDDEALDEWNADFLPKIFDKLLKEQKTICSGYAYILKELAALADIKCKIINGYGRINTSNVGGSGIPNHSWNAVEINNKWYLCDPTWSSGTVLFADNSPYFVYDYQDHYFLADPKLFAKNHHPLEPKWSLMDNTPPLKDFLKAPFIYKSAFKHGIVPIAPSAMKQKITKGEQLLFQFEASEKIDPSTINLAIFNGLKHRVIQPLNIQTNNGIFEFQHLFEKTGLYDVHLKMEDDVIVTYTIKVVKNRK